jgi:2-oxoglutarate dehydrogenase E2 component (dihydrolipoamide succinyltransferase)
MATPILMPKLGESVVEGTVARWLKAPGDAVARLEPLLEITTDKIDTEIPAPADGVLLDIAVPEGKTVTAGTVLGAIGAPGESAAPAPATAAQEQPAAASAATPAPAAGRPDPGEKPEGRTFLSPVVKRLAQEHDVDLARIEGTGLRGRITKRDVLEHLAAAGGQPAPEPQAPVRAPEQPVGEDETLQPLTAMRRAIAEHMVRSKATSPHVATVFEVDMTAVVLHRERHKADYAARGVKLTFTPYFVAAAAAALRAVPEANSRFSGQGIVLNRRVHVGVAVAVPNGLLVPVIRDADERNLQGLARALGELAEQARGGTLLPDALQGGTFTITNHGVGGSLIGTPIINQPQAGILGVGAIAKRPVVRAADPLLPSADDAIVIRPMCYLTFSFDHRILDGAAADAFMSVVKQTLETWPGQGERNEKGQQP